MSDDEMWEQIEAKEVRLWVNTHTGLWCPTCALPSAVAWTIQSDPADEPEESAPSRWLCTEDGHRS